MQEHDARKLPRGITTYSTEAGKIARQLAKSVSPRPEDRQALGRRLIEESAAAVDRMLSQSRISLDDWSVQYWTKALGVSRDELLDTVKQVGPSSYVVKRKLGSKGG
jgi:hypothetical protein